MEKKISINLYIAEHHFPLTVTTEEEEILRKAAKLLNDKLSLWQKEAKYKGLQKQKMIAGASLTVIAELLVQTKIAGKDILEKELEEIHMLLEDNMVES